MGGVWKKIPYTYVLMIVGTLALTGFPFLSGYYSKDAIIEFAYFKGSNIGYYATCVGIATAFLTSIYSWRLIFKTFHGKYKNKKNNRSSIHESPLTMLLPAGFLALGSIFVGFYLRIFLLESIAQILGRLNFIFKKYIVQSSPDVVTNNNSIINNLTYTSGCPKNQKIC